jgi:hypothetical protein
MFLGKSDSTPLLLVPGGSARRKAEALGRRGRDAVRSFVERGGNYLGFCGGAGLALSHKQAGNGLQICPLRRGAYPERLHHLVSGHVLACVARPGETETYLNLPVWWPGRFEAQNSDASVSILARCEAPGKDFCIADMPFRRIPGHIFAIWRDVYDIDLSADFLRGQPLVVSGKRGLGTYLLSYSHLETPGSPQANAWFADILRRLTGARPERALIPQWDLRNIRTAWPENAENEPLLRALQRSHALLRLTMRQRLFFPRTPWLAGWRAGLPGAIINSLHAVLCAAAALEPGEAAREYWRGVRERFSRAEELFFPEAEGWLLAFRLAQPLAPSLSGVVDRRGLEERRAALFGEPMRGGGLAEELIALAEELVYLGQ